MLKLKAKQELASATAELQKEIDKELKKKKSKSATAKLLDDIFKQKEENNASGQ